MPFSQAFSAVSHIPLPQLFATSFDLIHKRGSRMAFFVNGWRVPAGAKGDVSCLNVKLRVFSSLHFIDWVCMSWYGKQDCECLHAGHSLSIPHPYQVFLTGICYSSLTSPSSQPPVPPKPCLLPGFAVWRWSRGNSTTRPTLWWTWRRYVTVHLTIYVFILTRVE